MMTFLAFCEVMFKRYPNMDGAFLLELCEVAYQEIKEKEGN